VHAAVAPAVEVAEDKLPNDSPGAHDFVVRCSVFRHVLQDMKHVCMRNIFLANHFLKRLVVTSLIWVTEPDALKMTEPVTLDVIWVRRQVGEVISLLSWLISLYHEKLAHDLVEVVSLHVVEDKECKKRFHRFDRTTNAREPSEEIESRACNLDLKLVKLELADKRVLFATCNLLLRMVNCTHLGDTSSRWICKDCVLFLKIALPKEKSQQTSFPPSTI